MFRSHRIRKRLKKLKKVKEGDGHRLKPYRLWNMFTHSLFHMTIKNPDGETTHYALKSKYFTEEPRVDLYREGRHIAYSKLPAVLPVERGIMEVTTSSTGINGIHYRTDHEDIFTVYPDKRSIRGFRWWVHQRLPRLSTWIGWVAIVTLLSSLSIGSIQLMDTLSNIPWVSEQIGTFNTPISLSASSNVTIGVAAVLAGTERTLMLRNHWLVDIETVNWGE